jgi:hypothetical protein
MFPGNGQINLTAAWNGITGVAANIKQSATGLIAASAVSRKVVLDFQNNLAAQLSLLNTYSAVSGLAAYAQNQLNNTIDIVAEFNTMKTQVVATQDWVVANFPHDASGNLVVYSFNASKQYMDINLTTGELAAFKNQLSLLAATIN